MKLFKITTAVLLVISLILVYKVIQLESKLKNGFVIENGKESTKFSPYGIKISNNNSEDVHLTSSGLNVGENTSISSGLIIMSEYKMQNEYEMKQQIQLHPSSIYLITNQSDLDKPVKSSNLSISLDLDSASLRHWGNGGDSKSRAGIVLGDGFKSY